MATLRKLIVEVVDARNLVPKDGHGASSPYAILDFLGQRRKTRTVIRDLNPAWNEILEFNADKTSDVFGDMLELHVFHDVKIGPTTRNNFLGRLRLSSRQFVRRGEEALIYYPLEKKNLLSWIQGEIGLKIYFADELVPPPEVKADPAPPPPEAKAEPAPSPPLTEVNADKDPDTAGMTDAELEDSETPVAEEKKPPAENPTAENASSPAAQDVIATPDQNGKSSVSDQNPDLLKSQVSSGFVPGVKVNSLNAPQLINRVSSVSSFASDLSDRSTVERSSFDLVDKMHYIFVRVVKARSLPAVGAPVVKITVSGHHVISRPARRAATFDWDQTFAFGRGDLPDSSAVLEVSVWDPAGGDGFLGGICFDAGEIPLRDPPDSPLAPQWYRLEGGGANQSDLMLAAWIGTQADESFPDAWKADAAGSTTSRSKVYQSPKLWYVRSSIIEAQDLPTRMPPKEWSYHIKAQLGFQVQKTKSAISSTGAPSWNEDLMFVAAEPLTEHSITFFLLENRPPLKEPLVIGIARVPLTSIERRVDDRTVAPRWSTLEDPSEDKRSYRGRIHLRLCFDGGYHVMDEGTHFCSDYRPTARQLWKPPIGTIELGIISCRHLIPTKMTSGGKGSADAYAVAKYGDKWVRTRTISDSLDPRWNEQYTWRVYDPSTVLTLGVFDSWEPDGPREPVRPDSRLGKVRIGISTLSIGRGYRCTFPLLLLSRAGLKKVGEIELAVRFTQTGPTLDLFNVYTKPLLPAMHHLRPLGNAAQQEVLRSAAAKIVSAHLSRSEPPLRPEVVAHMLDLDSTAFSMRRVRANWFRIIKAIAGMIELFKWVDETRSWRNPTATVLVHALLVMLVWFPDLIVPTLAFYVFAVGAWNYRFRPKSSLPHFDTKLSLAESIDPDELDEEFDSVPSIGPSEVVRIRYEKLRVMGARAQVLLGELADQGERVEGLVAWRDPRATGIFVGLCLVVALVLYLVPPKMVAVAFGFYYLRHPIFRDRMPSPAINFFRRLPSLADRLI